VGAHALPGIKDRGLLELAEGDGRVVFTLDKDFWLLALPAAHCPQTMRRSAIFEAALRYWQG